MIWFGEIPPLHIFWIGLLESKNFVWEGKEEVVRQESKVAIL